MCTAPIHRAGVNTNPRTLNGKPMPLGLLPSGRPYSP